MEIVEYQICDLQELEYACMPFIKNGGLFIKTSSTLPLGSLVKISLKLLDSLAAIEFQGKVVWLTPKREYTGLPEGMGIQFIEEDSGRMRKHIETLLPNAFSIDRKENSLLT
ncbi:MAG: pilus assembly protein PilZ [Gammaproteobacteria bacterium]|jgi:type IV pilus assembly protein PilZ|nr:pilus assembly protein PilZ [Gammaproteobacteria bacterium]